MNQPRIHLAAKLRRGDFSLEVDLKVTQRVLGIVGPSGCGKSTLVGIAAGLSKPDYGELQFEGQTWSSTDLRQDLASNRRQIGLVPQDGLLFPHLDVRGNLVAGRHSLTRPEARQVEHLAERLGIAETLHRSVSSLSGGQRQRVALGRALLSGARWLLLDEPLGALDYVRRRSLLPLLRRVVDTTDVPLWFVSHDIAEVKSLCDEVIVLERGRIVFQGKPEDMAASATLSRAPEERYENLLSGSVEQLGEDLSSVIVGANARIFTRAVNVAVNQPVFVSIYADDIMIALNRPIGLSARNVLPAQITKLPSTHSSLVTIRLEDGTSLQVQLASSTIAELELQMGKQVYVLFKASACRLWADSLDLQAEWNHL